MLNRLFYTLLFSLFILQMADASMILPADGRSLFASGRWVKIETSSSGIHKINFSWLKNIGFLHPEKVRLYGSKNEEMSRWNSYSTENTPVQIPTLQFKENGGDVTLLFFVQGPVNWKFDPLSGQYHRMLNQSARGKSYFYLTEDTVNELLFQENKQPTGNPNVIITDYDDCAVWEEENINLLESGKRWFSALLTGGNILNRNFQFQDRLEMEPVTIDIDAAGRSSSPTGMEISANGNVMGVLQFNPILQATETDFASTGSFATTRVLTGTTISLSLKYNGTSSDQCWFDCATIQLRRSLQYRGIPLLFRDGRTVGKNRLAEYQINGATAGLLLWDVTNPVSPSQTDFQLNSGLLTFRSGVDSLRNFVLFDPQGQYPGLTKTEEVKNTDILHTEVPQYLILTPEAFLNQAERLAETHRKADGMTVTVITVEAVFNELSGGYPDVSALRNFIRYLYWNKNSSGRSVLKYLLLFGKGTCDPVHNAGDNNPNWIPTVQSENSLNSVSSLVSDDFFGRLDPGEGDQTGNVDIGIGRIPAATLAEATIAVDKIIHYHEAATLGDWRNNITFIGDDEDNNLHVDDSEKLASMVNLKNTEYSTSKIYFDAYPQVLTPDERYPEVTDAIRRSVQTGDLIVNYVGHASEDGLASERVLTIKDIDNWTNKDRLPLFVTATCEFSRWDMTVKRSAGEHLLFHPAGGAIALLSATRLVYSASNFEINKSFFNHAFDQDGQGAPLRLGDLIRLVKNENGGTDNTSKFCLLGDPALRLNYPEYHCRNIEINHQPVEQFSGILSPLGLVNITGEIQDKMGKKMDIFNGSLSVQVYDQPTGKKTLGNGGLPPFAYQVQENILFNGVVPVKNGTFTYSFVVPKDVNFNKEAGLIRYYFSNGTADGNGSFSPIHFNGIENLSGTDNKGPDIRLYLEYESFREGGTVSANPLLKIYLNDESGINTSGIGIGHNITLELDGQVSGQVILNDFYKADAGTWKSGTILYQLSALTNGSHTLIFKVWDTANNSSSLTSSFVVNNGLKIYDISNFPNPFSDQTRFVITHNHYNELFGVGLEVMDQTGRIVWSEQSTLASGGYEIRDLYWKPLQLNPVPVSGVYLYRITITGQDGQKQTKAGRLIWRQ